MMATAKQVMNYARSQIGYCESPKNSNRTKYGKAFGVNGEPWCFIFEWACGNAVDKKNNPFPHNSNAAYGQDEIVSKKGGIWIMKKNRSRSARKAALKKYKEGDCVDFDFGAMDAYRRHTGLVDHVAGEFVYCVEGNTTPDGKSGSQANGGCVAMKKRHYSAICSCARPKYGGKPEPLSPLEVDGIMGYETISRLQRFIKVPEDGEIGPVTTKALQKKIGMSKKEQDGEWGKKTTTALQHYLTTEGFPVVVNGKKDKQTIKALQKFLNAKVKK